MPLPMLSLCCRQAEANGPWHGNLALFSTTRLLVKSGMPCSFYPHFVSLGSTQSLSEARHESSCSLQRNLSDDYGHICTLVYLDPTGATWLP